MKLKTKRMISKTLSTVLVLGMLPASVFAEEPFTVDVFSQSDLAKAFDAANQGKEVTAKLKNDITLKDDPETSEKEGFFELTAGNLQIIGEGNSINVENYESSAVITVGGGNTETYLTLGLYPGEDDSDSLEINGLQEPEGNQEKNVSIIEVQDNGSLTMNEGTIISGNSSPNKNSLSVTGVKVTQENENNQSQFIMNGGNITGCDNSGVKVEGKMLTSSQTGNNGGATFYIASGSIKGNYSAYGGGVYINKASASIGKSPENRVKIEGNSSKDQGGGIYVSNGYLMSFYADIIKNTSSQGGGIYSLDSQIIINNGDISENTAHSGGGISYFGPENQESSISSISESKITKNIGTGVEAGSTYQMAETLEIEDSEISENYGDSDNNIDGGGIYVDGEGACVHLKGNTSVIKNKKILKNGLNGAGVDLENGGSLIISDNIVIKDNNQKEKISNLYFGDENSKVTTGKLEEKTSIGVRDKNIRAAFTQLYSKSNPEKDPSSYFVSDDPDFRVAYSEDESEARLIQNFRLTYDANGGTGNMTDEESPYTEGSQATVKENQFTNPQFNFIGWNTAKDGSGKAYNAGDKIEMNSSLTLYAQWKKKPGSGGNSNNSGSDKPVVNPESDIPSDLNGKDHYAYIVGYDDGLVHPELNMTRAEIATIFFRLLNDDIREANVTEENSFSDVKKDSWYNTEISTMAKMGIIKGYKDGKFNPEEPITRAEFSALVMSFAENEKAGDYEFKDINGHWAENDIKKAAKKGWVNGYPDNTFKPNQYISRAEVMAMVNRILERSPKSADDLTKDMKTWPDNMNTDSWFYLDVQEATNSHKYVREKDGHEKWTDIIDKTGWNKY